jgi:hypothetical protein
MEITFRAVIEVLGKPKDYVEKSLKLYLEKLKGDDNYSVTQEEYAEPKEQKEDMWAVFAEVEVKTSNVPRLIDFCIDYMPSVIEVVQPSSLTFNNDQINEILNDLQAKLHTIDMVAKNVKMENDFLKSNMTSLLKNYISVLLGKQELTSSQLSSLTGVKQDKLEDYLDQLIDEGKIDLKGEVYFLKRDGSEVKTS